jgi:hypothetical protein
VLRKTRRERIGHMGFGRSRFLLGDLVKSKLKKKCFQLRETLKIVITGRNHTKYTP